MTIPDDDLHAYVDGALDEARRLEVEAWLAAHPADAERAHAWAAQSRALHDVFDPVLNEPLPIDLLGAARRTRGGGPRPWRAVAAVAALTVTGLLGYGIGQRSAPAPASLAQFSRDAALAHAVFTPEQRHPVEVEAVHADHLVAWLSKRLGTSLAAPDFTAQGFRLLGGRLLSGGKGPVAQFMYEDGGRRRVTLYVRRGAGDNGGTAFRHAVENGVEVFYWIDGDMGYALSGNIGHGDMERLADAAWRRLGGGVGTAIPR